jgi:hypothetical protein
MVTNFRNFSPNAVRDVGRIPLRRTTCCGAGVRLGLVLESLTVLDVVDLAQWGCADG